MGLTNKKILVTCGPTWVAIDPMRVLSNRSTGALGQQLAQDLCKAGAKVTLLEGPVRQPLQQKTIRVIKYEFFSELKALLKKELSQNAAVIHAAAVSDYQPAKVYRAKLRSGQGSFRLSFRPTEKIINRIKPQAPGAFLVGFKFETTGSESKLLQQAKKLMVTARCDMVVANTLKRGYRAYLLGRDHGILAKARSRQALSRALVNALKDKL
jgi:phosphopantothenoylcysteine decarboxylase/phosphopantothenate--cysteine ligase